MNVDTATQLIREAKESGAEYVLTPEMTNILDINRERLFAAIAIDVQRPNGFKNLGMALRGQGRFAEAAECFVKATQADASDVRALKLLEELLEQHPELGFDFASALELCQKAAEVARERYEASQPVVQRGWRKRVFLLRVRISGWWKRLRS